MKKKLQKNSKKYYCKKCDFTSKNKNDFRRHLSTTKHKMDNAPITRITKKTPYACMLCGKIYKYASGLSKHKKKCQLPSDEEGAI